MINIWHNYQYILFVWMFNNRRFGKGLDPKARFLSYISQPGRIWLYLLTCITITGAVYWGVLRTIDMAALPRAFPRRSCSTRSSTSTTTSWDALIWKTRRRGAYGLPTRDG